MRRLIGLLLLGLLVASCAGPEVGAAPELEVGRDICEECGMIISDERFAAGFVDDNGNHVFDDLGGLLSHLAGDERLDEVIVWVKDYGNPEWIEAETAHFVRGTGVRSPMEFGIAALGTHEAAMALAGEVDGALLTWSELKSDAQEGTISAHDHAGMDHDDDMDEGMEEGMEEGVDHDH